MAESEPLYKGLKVLEMATYIFGPGSAAILSDFGADVIKIEAPGRGDPLRYAHKAPPFMPLDFDYIWQQDNRNKRSIALDIKTPEGREIFLALLRQADIFITNFPPNVLERLKIRYEDVVQENARLIYGQITGFGEQGPEASAPGFDATAYWARSGLMDLVRTANSEPSISSPGNTESKLLFLQAFTPLSQIPGFKGFRKNRSQLASILVALGYVLKTGVFGQVFTFQGLE